MDSTRSFGEPQQSTVTHPIEDEDDDEDEYEEPLTVSKA
jgi:hypothetical protein